MAGHVQLPRCCTAIKALSDRVVAVLDQLHITTQPSTYIPFIAIMKFVTALVTSVATLSAANPLPVDSDVKSSLVARTDIVPVTCPTLNNANQVTSSVGNIHDAFTIGSGILRMKPPPPPTQQFTLPAPMVYTETQHYSQPLIPCHIKSKRVLSRSGMYASAITLSLS